MRDITNLEEYEVIERAVISRKQWVCDFCGVIIKPKTIYYYVINKKGSPSYLRCCQQCELKYFLAEINRLIEKMRS
jgi:hypothetical protein